MVDPKRMICKICLLFLLSLIEYSFASDNFKFHEPVKISKDIKIDGYLNKNEWPDCQSIRDFIQVEPDMLDSPTEETSVKILYNDKYIYFGVVLYQNKNTISYKMGEYDDFMNVFEKSSDYFVIELDTQNNHDSSYGFAINASNVRSDYMVYGDEEGEVDDYWNATWESAVVITDYGWVLEIAIPLSELRFPDQSNQDWGLNFMRYIKSKNETSFWSFIPDLQNKFISTYGHLVNLDVNYSNNYKFTPYFSTGKVEYDDIYYEIGFLNGTPSIDIGNQIYRKKNITKDKIGFDFKYAFKSSNVIDFTYNPDYGQINQDPSIINNTAYEIEFDEKRLFFLENSSFYTTPIKVFYSRRIGGDVIKSGDDFFSNMTFDTDFNTAVSYLGSKNNIQYGFLYGEAKINKGQSLYESLENVSIKYYLMRNKFKISDYGFIGIIGTYYHKPNFNYRIDKPELQNRQNFKQQKSIASGIDFSFNFPVINNLYIDGQIVQTQNDNILGKGLNVELDYVSYIDLSKYVDAWVKIEKYNKNFDISKMGYLYRNDLQDFNLGIAYTNQNPRSSKTRKFILKYLISKNYDNNIIQNNLDFSFNNTFKNYYKIAFGIAKDFKHYIDKFYDTMYFNVNQDILTKAILYDKFSLKFSNDQRLFNSYSIGFEYFVDNFNDYGKRLIFNDKYKINDRIEVEFAYDNAKQFKKFQFLKIKEIESGGSGGANSQHMNNNVYDYLFVSSNNEEKTFSLQISSQYTKNVTIQFYYEFYKYLNDWNSDKVYKMDLSNPDLYPIYDGDIMLNEEEDGIIYISDYSSVIANFVIKAKLFSNSNLHFVYSYDKGINGKSFNNPFDVLNFNADDINQDNLAEVFYDHSFFIKFDILFNN